MPESSPLCFLRCDWALGGMQSLTFRTGARKTEVPVKMKTMIPVTLCSLVEKSIVRGDLEILSEHSHPLPLCGP